TFVGKKPLTYREVGEAVKTLTRYLHSRGVKRGDRVALLSENMPNWGIAFFAVTTLGAVAVPILPDFTANQIHHIIRHAGCKAVFVSEKLLDRLEEGEFSELETAILIDTFSIVPLEAAGKKLKKGAKKQVKGFSKLQNMSYFLRRKLRPEVKEDDLASIIYTSGTTGHSKGVMLTHKNLVSNTFASMTLKEVNDRDRFLSILPLSHTIECTIGFLIPFSKGACIYYLEKRPTPRLLMQAFQQVKPTMMVSVPLIIEKIYKTRIHPQLTKSGLVNRLYKFAPVRKKLHQVAGKKLLASFGGKLKFFGIGGAKLGAEVERFLREAKFPYAVGYGLTETSPLIAGVKPELTKFRSTGPAIPGVEIKIDQPNPQTGEGEILVKGPNVMKGYYQDPERTKQVFTKDGWFRTGDLGKLDSDNYLYIMGRLKNMILGPSGENIYPEEIESLIDEHDLVLESLVFLEEGNLVARVHLNYEELDKMFLGKNLSETKIEQEIKRLLEEIRQGVNEKVASFSRISKIIEQTEPFEKTPTLKVKRYLYAD
ncbi:MAG TPA: long-chain fatty acid--CoA ligase, partial [Caldithrix sp.]|nr:long-chain fatty acid--CoA ligase [Caldithrix sp.]